MKRNNAIKIGKIFCYRGKYYKIVHIDNNSLITAEAPANEYGGIPTIIGDKSLFAKLFRYGEQLSLNF